MATQVIFFVTCICGSFFLAWGEYGNWMNVQVDGEKEPNSVDWDELTWWESLSDDGKAILLTANEEMSQA